MRVFVGGARVGPDGPGGLPGQGPSAVAGGRINTQVRFESGGTRKMQALAVLELTRCAGRARTISWNAD